MLLKVSSKNTPRPGGFPLDWSHVTIETEDGEQIPTTRLGLEVNAGDFVKLRVTEIDGKRIPNVREFLVENILIETREDWECEVEDENNPFRERLATFRVNKRSFVEKNFKVIDKLFDKAMKAAKGRKPETLSLVQPLDHNGNAVEEEGFLVFHLYAN